MQTPGAENAMLKKRVAGCTDDRRSVAEKCHFSRVWCVDYRSHVRSLAACA
jgi:hypothetical protein